MGKIAGWIGTVVIIAVVISALWTSVVQPALAGFGINIDITGPWGNGTVGE